MKNQSALINDGVEAVAQGMGQRGARAIYDDNVELISRDNPNAVFNPRAMLMDGALGTAGSLTTAGMHAGTKALDKPANAAAARLERKYFKEEIKEGNKGLSDAALERQVELLEKLTNGHVLEASEIRDLDKGNENLQRIFTRKTGVPITSFDTKREDVLRQKYQFGALKVNKEDAVKPKYPIAKLGDAAYTIVTKKPVKQSYKHGNWDGVNFLEEKDIFVGKHLKANTSYVCGENQYNYQTDGAGRIQNATGVLLPKKHKGREGIKDNQTPGKLKGDHASHIFADLFGGSPGLGNLISLKARVNQSDHRKIEIIHQKALAGQGKVYVDYDIHYSGDDERPDKVTVTFFHGKDFDSMELETIEIHND